MSDLTIAYISHSPSAYSRQVARGVVKYIAKTPGINLQILGQPGFAPLFASKGFRGDGIITMLYSKSHEKEFKQMGIPVVNVSTWVKSNFPTFNIDNHAIGQLAAQHYLSRGFHNFAFLSIDLGASYSKTRKEGFANFLDNKGFQVTTIGPSHYVYKSTQTWQEAIDTVAGQLSSLPKPLGLFCSVDSSARLAIQACQQAGLSIPHEVAIIGVDNDELICYSCSTPLSSIEQGEERIGFTAAAYLHKVLKGEEQYHSFQKKFPPLGLIERQSSDFTAVNDEGISRALLHIKSHLGQKILVDDLAAISGYSRTIFERKFRQFVGNSPNNEMRRLRIEKSRELLLATDLTLDDVATQCGFTRRERFHEAFKKICHDTPSNYRRLYSL